MWLYVNMRLSDLYLLLLLVWTYKHLDSHSSETPWGSQGFLPLEILTVVYGKAFCMVYNFKTKQKKHKKTTTTKKPKTEKPPKTNKPKNTACVVSQKNPACASY